MESIASQSHVTPVCTYTVATSDMFYGEVSERVVYVSDTPDDGFRIWVQIPGEERILAMGMCEIFLEYAMTCVASGESPQACCNIDAFGTRLGQILAHLIQERTPASSPAELAAHAMECILRTMNVPFRFEALGDEKRYVLATCPLHGAAQRTGLREVELAHRGVQALCQSLVASFDPSFTAQTPSGLGAEHIFRLVTPTRVGP